MTAEATETEKSPVWALSDLLLEDDRRQHTHKNAFLHKSGIRCRRVFFFLTLLVPLKINDSKINFQTTRGGGLERIQKTARNYGFFLLYN